MNTRQPLILRRQKHTALFLAIVGLGTPVYYWAAASIIDGYVIVPEPGLVVFMLVIGALFAASWWVSVRFLPKRWTPLVLAYWAFYPFLTLGITVVGVYLFFLFPLPHLIGSALAAALHYAYLRTRPAEPDPNTCPICGYDRRGLRHGVCPECGKPG